MCPPSRPCRARGQRGVGVTGETPGWAKRELDRAGQDAQRPISSLMPSHSEFTASELTGETPSPLDLLRELLRGEPMEPDADWNEACAEWIHEHGAQVEALAEAAHALVWLKDGPRSPTYYAAKDAAWDNVRAALVPFAARQEQS